MSGIFHRPDGTSVSLSGYRYRPPAETAKKYSAQASQVEKLPPKVDLRPHMTAVENQGELMSCVANAVAGAYEYLVKRHQGEGAYDVSRLFVYYNARAKEGPVNEDGGSYIADAIASLGEFGACSEATWSYDPQQVNTEPSADAYSEAEEFLVEDVVLVPLTLDDWRHTLAEGYPIVFGISLYESFDKQKKAGVVPLPSPAEAARAAHGGHSMLCVGYSDPDQMFIVRNSWGTDWGDKGYCYIPYSYLVNPKFNSGDCWMIRQVEPVGQDEGTWGDDESMIGDMDTELAKMSDADFQAMIEAMGETHLETRLALIFLACAAADGEISDDELTGIAEYVQQMLEELGSSYDANKVLHVAQRKAEHREDLLDESVQLFAQHMPQTMLASILRSLGEIVGTDDISAEEEEFLALLVEAWQIDAADVTSEASEEDGSDEDYSEEEEESEEDYSEEEEESDEDYSEEDEVSEVEESEEDYSEEEEESDEDYSEEDEVSEAKESEEDYSEEEEESDEDYSEEDEVSEAEESEEDYSEEEA